MQSETTRVHTYHAEAYVLDAQLETPVKSRVEPQAQVCLSPAGGYRSQRVENFRLESVISVRSGYTQVAGNPSPKKGHGWVTLATAVLEGFNVLDVVTADRIVAQLSTEHPLVGYIPRVTFLGTRFENLRINGHEVNPELDLEICGAPDPKRPYVESKALAATADKQHKSIAEALEWARERYGSDQARLESQRELECSLVTRVAEIPGTRTCGHVIDVPEFGKIFLAELSVSCYFQLTMVRLELGCVGDGSIAAGRISANGKTKP